MGSFSGAAAGEWGRHPRGARGRREGVRGPIDDFRNDSTAADEAPRVKNGRSRRLGFASASLASTHPVFDVATAETTVRTDVMNVTAWGAVKV